MREFWGLKLQDCGNFDWSSSVLPEDHPAVFGPLGQAMATVEPFICEGRYRRADGEVRVLRTRAQPYRDELGAFAGMVGVNEDITELRAVEHTLSLRNMELAASVGALKSTADRFALASSISGLAMSEHDQELRYTWAHNVPDSLGKTPSEIVGPEVGQPLERLLRRTLETGESQNEELSFLMGEQRMWVDIQSSPTTLPDGQAGVIASAMDVTARKLNESKLEVLAKELSHRVKNVFAVVQAIIRQSARTVGVPDTFVKAVEGRLVALSEAQNALLQMGNDQFQLDTLLNGQLSHLDRVDISGPEIRLPGRLAPYVSLAVHELGTNALKYGSLSVPGGRVLVRWEKVDEQNLQLRWEERDGPSPKKAESTATRRDSGFGSKLLTTVFDSATGGSSVLMFASDGLVWTATIPTTVRLTL
ncbi:hypothetical protein KOAAANKH_02083 [Brevundimonas sp. NIBR10]|nr:hypothetical protein KOAAANKH_02083 [Brevundimonas sp. NIBR10]